MANQRERMALLATVPLLSGLNRAQLKHLAMVAHTVELERHSTIVTQGDPGDAAFILIDGRAEVRRDEEVIATLGSGDVFGELALLTGDTRTATVSMTKHGEVLRIERAGFLEAVRSRPEIGLVLATQLAGRLVKANLRK